MADGNRTAWKQRLDADCLVATYGSLLGKSNSDSTDDDTCVACGGTSASDWDPVFLNLYLPKQEVREYELHTCAACAAKLRITMQQGAERLEDRSTRSPSPSAPSTDAFANLPF